MKRHREEVRMKSIVLPAGTESVLQFTDHEAGSISTKWMTQANRDKELADKQDRYAKGYYTMSEVAQMLADTYDLDAADLLKRMKANYHAGEIVIRSRGTEAPVLPGHTLRDFYDWMVPDDIRAMLKHWGGPWGSREFPFLAPNAATAQTLATPAHVETATGKKWTPDLLAELGFYRDTHGTKKTALHYRISEQRVRQLLPKKKPETKGYSAFTHHAR
jgi:hypothetical protein